MSCQLLLLLFCIINASSQFTPFHAKIEGEIIKGMYWTDVNVGTPSQKLRLHLDTGSNLMIVESSSCATCKYYFNGYNVDVSNTSDLINCNSNLCDANTCNTGKCGSTFCSSTKCCSRINNALCGFYVAYGDGSKAEGGLTRDTITVVSPDNQYSDPVTTTFGLVLEESGTWSETSDGLLGLAYDNLYCSPTCYKTWIDEYYLAHKAEGASDIFSMCFGEEDGILGIGGIDKSLYEGSVYWVDIQNPAFYTLRLRGFQIGNYSIPITVSSAIIDSGTTLIYLPTAMFNSFVSSVTTNYPNAAGISGTNTVFDGNAMWSNPSLSWPSLYISFDGVVIRIPPSVYFLRIPYLGKYIYYLGITAGTSDYILLGDSFMRGLNIIHNREDDMIGFAVPSETCFEGAYSIINNYDPREDKWYNDTNVEIPESSIVDEIIEFCLEYFIEIAMVIIIILLIWNLVYMKRKNRLNPVRVQREAKRTIGIPYNRGFDSNKKGPIIPSDSIVSNKPKGETHSNSTIIEMREETVSQAPQSESHFVLNRPVYIQPVAPPKPK